MEPCSKAAANIAGQFELHRPTSLLLNDNGAGADIWAQQEVADL
jgi:hypothetical protein